MKNLLLILLVTLTTISSKSQHKEAADEINVLFIGNSLTYFYDMPQILQRMLNETNPNIKIEQSTFPGQSLSGHLSDIITSRTDNGISTRKKEEGEKKEPKKKPVQDMKKLFPLGVVSDDFKIAFDKFFDQVLFAKKYNWETTSYEAASQCIKSLNQLIGV
jgi:hypothetical protein